jgi:cytochrome oxidase Cu insertion factor (SCO1/SenC/PrrC family)
VEQVESVTRAYGVASMSEPDGEMSHQLVTVLIDPQGRIAEHYLGLEHEADEIRRDLENLDR